MRHDHYDVIIIGTRRRRRHARLPPRAVGQAHPAPRARRLRAAREGQLELARRQRRGASTTPRRRGTTRDGKPLHPHTNYYVGGNTKFYGAALFRLRARGLRRDPRTTAASRRRGRSPTTTSSRTTPRPSASTRCTASAARIRPSRRRARRIRIPAVSHEPRIQQLHDDLARAGPAAVPRAARRHARRAESAARARASAATPATASRASSHAKADAQVVLRRAGARASERHAADQRLRRRGWRPSASGREVTRVHVERDGARETLLGRHRGRRRAARSTRRRCCCARRTTGIRSGLANGSDVVGRHYMGHVNSVLMARLASARTRPSSRRRWR